MLADLQGFAIWVHQVVYVLIVELEVGDEDEEGMRGRGGLRDVVKKVFVHLSYC